MLFIRNCTHPRTLFRIFMKSSSEIVKNLKLGCASFSNFSLFLQTISFKFWKEYSDIVQFHIVISNSRTFLNIFYILALWLYLSCRSIINYLQYTSLKDREEVLSKSKLLKSANIYVSEDFSRKTREHRNELFKYMRYVSIKKDSYFVKLNQGEL